MSETQQQRNRPHGLPSGLSVDERGGMPPAMINERASGATTARIGEKVTVVDYSLNRLAAWVQVPEGKMIWLPSRWLTMEDS